ncbi:tripartite tricarboxylate transporter TctB family protein [Martelella mediterranea]|uniref:Tripartite tricarboxylate transporter TctB family protein n=1 Tax=Martelella mediterranea DSM 17316 TaxID=1122214 RepID=A0A1U9Z8H5_9HYPH|nr:tripartite tricarboxylate transporter TctB family protein [Martelella mediterranea]AQZ53930.1 Tripartite tricarboxylate transporter TctB family protein [Martelella mediterranea DSM 17316]
MADRQISDGKVSLAARISEAAVIGALALLVLVFFIQTFEEISAFARASQGRGPFFFPRFVLGVMALLIALLILLLPGARHRGSELPALKPALRMLALMAATAGYCAAMPVIGFLSSSIVFAIVVPAILGRRDILVLAAVAVSYSLAVWFLFERVFLILLPGFSWPW